MLREPQHDIAKNLLPIKTVSIRNVMLRLSKHLFIKNRLHFLLNNLPSTRSTASSETSATAEASKSAAATSA